jgi:hypothetical protein
MARQVNTTMAAPAEDAEMGQLFWMQYSPKKA